MYDALLTLDLEQLTHALQAAALIIRFGLGAARQARRRQPRLASSSGRRKELRSVERWHPIMTATEGPPATWRLIDGLGKAYATIELRRVSNGAEVRYRVTYGGEVIGWATTLRGACERAHSAFLRSHGPGGGPIASWGER